MPPRSKGPAKKPAASSNSRLDPQTAKALALGLVSGVTPDVMLQSLLPTATPEERSKTQTQWFSDPILAAEVASLNGGDWEHLEKGTRIQLAFDRGLAEQAYFLMSHRYDDLEGSDLGKWRAAFETVRAFCTGQSGERGDALDLFARWLNRSLEGAVGLTLPPEPAGKVQ